MGTHISNPTYLQPLLILQEKILKAITYSSMLDHSNPLFRDLELLKLSDIHSLQLLSFVYDCVNYITLDYFSDSSGMLLMLISSAPARQAIKDNLFLQRRHTTQYGIRSVQYSGAKL